MVPPPPPPEFSDSDLELRLGSVRVIVVVRSACWEGVLVLKSKSEGFFRVGLTGYGVRRPRDLREREYSSDLGKKRKIDFFFFFGKSIGERRMLLFVP